MSIPWNAPWLVLIMAFVLDAIIGEPPNALHPVVWIGRAIEPLKRFPATHRFVELSVGFHYAIALPVGLCFATLLVDDALAPYPRLRFCVRVYLLFSCFALRGLWKAGKEMRDALVTGDLAGARRALSGLCSRDAADLRESELSGATIESLSENTSDSVVAPLFYFVLFGVPGAVVYRVVNTMDAMVGYRGRYEYLGKTAARLDDLLNYIPARITTLVMCLAGGLQGLSSGQGLFTVIRDSSRTASPNAGRPMAMASGLLGVRLDKRDHYVLGAEFRAPGADDIRKTMRLVVVTATLVVALFVAWAYLRGERVGIDF
jgi:adenosylcobinamide-phosphate synthase